MGSILGSHYESTGFAPIEALACGTTPLVTNIPSFRRITGWGHAGALFPSRDACALAQAIREWSGRDPKVLRKSARLHFERALSFDAIGRQLRVVYETLASGR